ncbi:MAG: hypothetical protein JST67_08090 [Bacteroidetes bacterium]|nr:hypothetical protein [Bacteroidota bacterium]
MKKINFKKIGVILLWCVAGAALLSSLAFVNTHEKKVLGKSVTVVIEQDDDNTFVDEDDVLEFLKTRNDTFVNQPMKNINVYKVEKALNTHPSIANAEVAATVDGHVTIKVKQRKPIVRIISTCGESFYIDDEAQVMPLAEHYTARVITANGFIPEKYAQFYHFSIPQIEKDSEFKSLTVLDDIYNVAAYINNDSVLNSLITQIFINKDREIELYPAVGSQKIIFGDGTDIADKFEKLKTFYTKGLNYVNGWNKYSSINLKYKNQVVCIKKENETKAAKANNTSAALTQPPAADKTTATNAKTNAEVDKKSTPLEKVKSEKTSTEKEKKTETKAKEKNTDKGNKKEKNKNKKSAKIDSKK